MNITNKNTIAIRCKNDVNVESMEQFTSMIAKNKKTKPFYDEIAKIEYLFMEDVIYLIYSHGRFKSGIGVQKQLDKAKKQAHDLNSKNFFANWEKVRILEAYMKCADFFSGKNINDLYNIMKEKSLTKERAS